uniref:Uncharacterized protein n=1 Tax=Arundo donax TaxID=35708 RepID=A0A0A9GSL7_ARUDO
MKKMERMKEFVYTVVVIMSTVSHPLMNNAYVYTTWPTTSTQAVCSFISLAPTIYMFIHPSNSFRSPRKFSAAVASAHHESCISHLQLLLQVLRAAEATGTPPSAWTLLRTRLPPAG